MIKRVALASTTILLILSFPVVAQQSMTFDWEDGVATVLGTYGNANVANSGDRASSGTRSLKYWEDPISGTPQAYVWWVTGCAANDSIFASFYMYDDTPDPDYYPRGRIWAHYTTDPSDVTSYGGSAGGNSTYTSGIGWEQLSYGWKIPDPFTNDGFVVEARIYSGSAGSNDSLLYVDEAYIWTSSSTAIIHNAAGDVPVELCTFAASATPEEVELTWSTASEQDNLGFNILRAMGMGQRSAINVSMVPGAGTTLEPMFYSYVDRDIAAGLTYRYWLEQVDFQGTTEMFGPVSVAIPAAMPEAVLLGASPVPVDDATSIELSLPAEGMVSLSVYDLQGHAVSTIWEGSADAGTHTFNWERGDVAPGTYMLRAATSHGDATLRVILR